MTKQHFKAVAQAIKSARGMEQLETKEDVLNYLEGYFGAMFGNINPKFDKVRFYEACKK